MVRTSNSRSTSRNSRPAKATERATAKRREILRAAADAFRELGHPATGMRDIAQRAGLSVANLYYYFEGKDALIAFCQDQALDRMLAAVDAAEASGAAPEDRLRWVMEAQLRCMHDEVDGAAAHVAVDALPAELRGSVVQKRDRYERRVRAIIEEGAAAGAFRLPGDPALVTRAILDALSGTARWFRPDGPRTREELAATYTDYLLRGLRP